jgi:hypothetical protein
MIFKIGNKEGLIHVSFIITNKQFIKFEYKGKDLF